MPGLFFIACMICSGDPGSPLRKGAVAGILLLVGVVVGVLVSIVTTALTWSRRAHRLHTKL